MSVVELEYYPAMKCDPPVSRLLSPIDRYVEVLDWTIRAGTVKVVSVSWGSLKVKRWSKRMRESEMERMGWMGGANEKKDADWDAGMKSWGHGVWQHGSMDSWKDEQRTCFAQREPT